MWCFNPSQPRTFRSPAYPAGVFPFDQDTVQPLPPKTKIPQYGKFIPSTPNPLVNAPVLSQYVPGPIIRDQIVRQPSGLESVPPGFDQTYIDDLSGFPGKLYPSPARNSSDPVNGSTLLVGNHNSSSVFYNQKFPLIFENGYGASPYWRFTQWASQYPEYYIVDTRNKGVLKSGFLGSPSVGPIANIQVDETLLPVGLARYDEGLWLLRRSSGYLFRTRQAGEATRLETRNGWQFNSMLDPDYAGIVTWVPVYDLLLHRFPPVDIRFCLQFSSWIQENNVTPFEAGLAPLSWNLRFYQFSNLRTVSYLTFDPYPQSGVFRLKYGNATTSNINIPNTGNQVTDYATLNNELVVRINAIIPGTDNVEVHSVFQGSSWVWKIVITTSSYAALQYIDDVSSPVLPVAGYTYEDVDGAFKPISGNAIYMTPDGSFQQPTGECTDSRDIGDFVYSQATPMVGSDTNVHQFGEDKSMQGISYGGLSPFKETAFRLKTIQRGVTFNGDTNFYKLPGWSMPSVSFIPDQLAYQLIPSALVYVTPVWSL